MRIDEVEGSIEVEWGDPIGEIVGVESIDITGMIVVGRYLVGGVSWFRPGYSFQD